MYKNEFAMNARTKNIIICEKGKGQTINVKCNKRIIMDKQSNYAEIGNGSIDHWRPSNCE